MFAPAVGLLVLLLTAAPAPATVVFTASGPGVDGASLSASASFTISGNTLTILLSNVATSDNTSSGQDVPGNLLTGILFDLPDSITLTPQSALIPTGSSIVQASECTPGPCNASTTNVGGEFIYGTSSAFASGAPSGPDRGIASAGYISGAANFGGPNLDNPAAPNGMNFGIISLDPSFNPNGGMADEPLIKNSVQFQLLISGGTLTEDQISNVIFQYGTGFREPRLVCCDRPPTERVPGPATAVLLGSALLVIGAARRINRRRQAS
jgi:hypothetical protein